MRSSAPFSPNGSTAKTASFSTKPNTLAPPRSPTGSRLIPSPKALIVPSGRTPIVRGRPRGHRRSGREWRQPNDLLEHNGFIGSIRTLCEAGVLPQLRVIGAGVPPPGGKMVMQTRQPYIIQYDSKTRFFQKSFRKIGRVVQPPSNAAVIRLATVAGAFDGPTFSQHSHGVTWSG